MYLKEVGNGSRCYSAYSCGARKILSLGAAEFFDRGAISCSLHLPQAALALKATKLSHASIFNFLSVR